MIGPELEDYNHPTKLLLERLECLALQTTYEIDLPLYALSANNLIIPSVKLDLKQFEPKIKANAWPKVNNNTSKVKQCYMFVTTFPSSNSRILVFTKSASTHVFFIL
ncbi:1529_t:CDS:2 [Dentiscutata erythropus]|uniref:1529_t:CDS:1 n=1 Tax=Dentiscutata erythropus TaxID=1348616 RepID=A0A9N9DLZ9_9GLOM|nr:1529_t:CDS:2 [Dentiscutata erythropus]